MQLVPEARDLDAQLVHDPWAMLRRTTHSKYEPPTPQLAAPGTASLQIHRPRRDMAPNCLSGVAGSVVLCGAGEPAEPAWGWLRCQPRPQRQHGVSERLLWGAPAPQGWAQWWGAEPAAQTPGEPNLGRCRGWLPTLRQIALSPAYPPKARMCCFPGDTRSPQRKGQSLGRTAGARLQLWGDVLVG